MFSDAQALDSAQAEGTSKEQAFAVVRCRSHRRMSGTLEERLTGFTHLPATGYSLVLARITTGVPYIRSAEGIL